MSRLSVQATKRKESPWVGSGGKSKRNRANRSVGSCLLVTSCSGHGAASVIRLCCVRSNGLRKSETTKIPLHSNLNISLLLESSFAMKSEMKNCEAHKRNLISVTVTMSTTRSSSSCLRPSKPSGRCSAALPRRAVTSLQRSTPSPLPHPRLEHT